VRFPSVVVIRNVSSTFWSGGGTV